MITKPKPRSNTKPSSPKPLTERVIIPIKEAKARLLSDLRQDGKLLE